MNIIDSLINQHKFEIELHRASKNNNKTIHEEIIDLEEIIR